MKVIIATSELTALLARLQNVVAQKPTIPILSNLLLEAKGDELILTATDLTVGMRCHAPAKVQEEGATTLPARRFNQLTKELTAAHLEITSDENEITEVVAGSSRFKLHGMSRKEFPSLPDISAAKKFTIPQTTLKNVLFRTSFAVSREDNRYVLTGVLMKVQDGKATFVGTDGKRLAQTNLNVPTDGDINGEYIIPLKAVEEIQKNLQEDEEVVFYIMPDKIAIEANGTVIITKLLTGDYPDISQVIPESHDQEVSLHREELITLLRQVSLFTSDTDQSVRFTFRDGELILSADSVDIGEGHVSMPVNYNGDALDIAFNPNFFLDILRHSREETVKMGLIDAYNPSIITEPANEDVARDVNPLYVLMPMRLSSK